MAPVLLIACSVLAANLDAAGATKTLPFERRDGAVEAAADIRAKRPTKLYTAVLNGRAPGFLTPGIAFCDPLIGGGKASKIVFADLPEANWQEPGPLSSPTRDAAINFARRYNQTMFNARKVEIKSACPKARLRG
ncbi:MAG: hypothetical protein ACKOPG_06075 [Novosphingobium sp.]